MNYEPHTLIEHHFNCYTEGNDTKKNTVFPLAEKGVSHNFHEQGRCLFARY